MTRQSPKLRLVSNPSPPGGTPPRDAGLEIGNSKIVSATASVELPGSAERNCVRTMGVESQCPHPDAPTPTDCAMMAAHGIQFDGCGFRFAGFRFDRLLDAVHQSRIAGQGRE